MPKTLADMTPEQARELLDGATPGPWEVLFDNEAIETDTSTVLCNTDGAVEWGRNIEHDVPLAAAAPELAQTIAGMTYEYGVQIDYPTGARLYVRPGICTKYPDRAWWTSKPSEAHAVAVKTREKNTHPVRLVRRLVSHPEEVQQ